MTQTVFLHYTQEELDRNFDQRAWAKNSEAVIARYAPRSAAVRARLAHQERIPYGRSPDEFLDFFPADRQGAPIQLFVHGGRWVNFVSADYSFVAEPLVEAGIHSAVMNFSKLPAVRLPAMVEQVCRALSWIHAHAASLGADPGRIYLAGHSSGAHMAALAAATDWAAQGLPAGLVRGATLVSGPYDMDAVMASARSAYVKLDPAEKDLMSPLRQAGRIRCPVIVAYADGDTDEFRRQSQAFAEALARSGTLAGTICVAGRNHFEIMETLGDRDGEIVRAMLAQAGAQAPGPDRGPSQ